MSRRQEENVAKVSTKAQVDVLSFGHTGADVVQAQVLIARKVEGRSGYGDGSSADFSKVEMTNLLSYGEYLFPEGDMFRFIFMCT